LWDHLVDRLDEGYTIRDDHLSILIVIDDGENCRGFDHGWC
jgi:hypothetical protein